MPLPYTPDRELEPPISTFVSENEWERCVMCRDKFHEDELTSDGKCSYCANPDNHED